MEICRASGGIIFFILLSSGNRNTLIILFNIMKKNVSLKSRPLEYLIKTHILYVCNTYTRAHQRHYINNTLLHHIIHATYKGYFFSVKLRNVTLGAIFGEVIEFQSLFQSTKNNMIPSSWLWTHVIWLFWGNGIPSLTLLFLTGPYPVISCKIDVFLLSAVNIRLRMFYSAWFSPL